MDSDDDYGCNSVDGKTLTVGGIAVKFDSPERTIIIGMPTSKEACPITVFKPPDNHTVLVIGGIGVMFEDNKICFGTDITVGDW